MASNLDEFKQFVKRHPLLKLEVRNKNKTWQQIYEDWVILNDDSMWDEYKQNSENGTTNSDSNQSQKTTRASSDKPTEKKESSATDDMIKNVLGYVKKINPDTITKYVGSIQKIIELIGAFGGGASASSAANKKTGDPLFDKRFDEWY